MGKGPLGIIGAMDAEVESLKAACTENGGAETVTAGAGTIEFTCGTIGTVPVVIAQCDVGMVNAALYAQAMIERFSPRAIVNTGVAGSLDARLDIGDILVAEDAVNHLMDVCNLGYEPGQTPGLPVFAFPCDEQLRKAALAAADALGLHARAGRIASGDRFVRDEDDKQRIASVFAANCCEMEGAAIAQACWLNGVPCAILRAISDKADGTDHIDYPTFEAKAAETCARLVIELANRLE